MNSVHMPLDLMKQATITFGKSIFVKQWWWQTMLGLLSHPQPSSTVGITPVFRARLLHCLILLTQILVCRLSFVSLHWMMQHSHKYMLHSSNISAHDTSHTTGIQPLILLWLLRVMSCRPLKQSTSTGLVIKLSSRAKPPQLRSLEWELSESVANLKGWNWIFGKPLTLDEFLNPIKEQEFGTWTHTYTVVFEDNMAIIAEVHCQEAVQNSDIIEVDLDDNNNGDSTPAVTMVELMELCQTLKARYISQAGANASLDFLSHVHAFHAQLWYEDTKNAVQTTLHRYMKLN